MSNLRPIGTASAASPNVPGAVSGLNNGLLEGLEQRTLMTASPSSVVFIADNVADRNGLTRAFAGAEVVMLDSSGDVFAQVSRALAGRGGLASIQFVTHGSAGRVQLGSGEGQTLDAATLAGLAGTISTWGDALSEDGDVILWGCQVAMGDVGRSFVSELSSTMRADAAASFNLTGSSRLGGDWKLELKLGTIEALSGFVAPVRYAGVLASPTISGTAAGQTVNETGTIRPFSAVVIGSDNSAATLSVSVTLDNAAKGIFTPASLSLSGFASAGSGVYTFSGTAAQATIALSRLVFNPADNRVDTGQTETTTFTISASNGVDPATTNSTTTVISTAVNQVPVISGALAGQTVADTGTIAPFSTVVVTDPDTPGQTLTVTVGVNDLDTGGFTSSSLTSAGFTAVGNGFFTRSGTAAQVTTALQALVFQPTAGRLEVGQTEVVQFDIRVSDGVAPEVRDATAAVTVSAANDQPTVTGTSAGQTVNDSATITPFSTVTIADADLGQILTVTLSLDNASKGTFTAATLAAGGWVTGGTAGSWTFTGTATQATWAIRQLVFNPTNDRVAVGQTETTTFTLTVNDQTSSAVTNTATTVISTSVNDDPTISGATAGQAVNDNSTLSPFSGLTIADLDPGQQQVVTVTLDNSAKGVFTPSSLTASGFVHSGGGVYTFTGTADQATTAIRALVFDPTDNRVNAGSTETTTFTIAVNDAVAAVVANAVTTAVSLSVNDNPTVSGAVAGQTVNDNATVLLFSGVTIGDVDNPAQSLSVSVTLDAASKGVFTAASLTASGFVDAGSGVYTFTGTAAQATTAIRQLVFDPTNNRGAVGSTETTTFSIAVSDQSGGSVSNSTATVVSTSVNDAPTITGTTAGQSVNDTATLQPFSGVTIGDVDHPSQTLTVTLQVSDSAQGTFSSASLATSGFVALGGGNFSFSGTAASATAAIRALVFQPTANRVAVGNTETTAFTINANDNIAAVVTNSTTTVVSTSINDNPTVSNALAGQAVNDNATLAPFAGLTIGDVDSPAQTLTVSVTLDTAAKGVFTSGSLTASGFVHAGGGVYTFSGTAAQATAAIRALVFDPTNNRVAVGQTETSTFAISVTDGTGGSAANAATSVVSMSINDAPTISGAAAGQAVNDNATITPFSGMTIGDVDAPAQTLSVSVTLDTAAKGVFTPASLAASGFVSAGGGVYTFTGTAAQATTAIRQLSFDPTNNRVTVGSTETTTFTVAVNDSSGGATSNSTATVVSVSINDLPSISGAVTGQAVNDNATIRPFSGVTVSDADSPAQTLTVRVTLDAAAKGVFTAASLTASGFSDNGGGVYSFMGTAEQATDAIQLLEFNPTNDRVAVGGTEITMFSVEVWDLPENEGTYSNSGTTVVSTSINDSPTVSGASASQPVNDIATIMPFSGMTIGDPDSPAQTLNVTVTLDTAAKGVFTPASVAASGFVDAGGGVYTFSGQASQATTAIRQLVFDPTNNRVAANATETITFTVAASDSSGGSVSNSTTTVVSTNVNDAPTIGGATSGQSVNDNATVQPFSGVTIADLDPGQQQTVTVTLDSAAKGVFTPASLAASGFVHSGSGVYTFTGSAADSTAAIRALVFDPANDRVAVGSTETTTFTIAASDGVAATVSNTTTTVVSTSINDNPTVAGATTGQAVNDDATVTPFAGLTIGDTDTPAQTLSVSVTLDTAAKGVFTPGSLTASGFVHAGGGVYTFSGTAAQATAAIRALVFDPANNRVAVGQTETSIFTVSVTDGAGGSAVNAATSVVSTSMNDVPVITGASAGQAVNDNSTVMLFASVTISDVDPGQPLTVSVSLDSAAKGVFTPASLTASGFAHAGGGVYTFSGTAAQATTAIRALSFDPTNNRVANGQTETTTFTISVNDVAPGAAVNNATTVVSTGVNDAPTVTGTAASQVVNDNATVNPFSAVTISDVDPDDVLTVSVSLDAAAKGVFTPGSLTASGFVHAGGGVYTFTGTAAQATTAIRQLEFNPTNDRVAVGSTETTTFTILAADTGAGSVSNSSTTVVSLSVNDTPTIVGATAGLTVNDDSTVTPFSGVTIGDVDNPAQSLGVSITLDVAAKGVFTPASLTASGFVDAGGGAYSFTGTAAQATTAIRQLVFNPANDRVAVGATETTTFSIIVTDSQGASAGDAATTVVSTSMNDAPTIGGASAAQPVNDNATRQPFSAMVIADVDPGQQQTVTVTLDSAAKGVFTPASLTASGFVSAGGGVYTFTGTAAAATTAIRALVFDPTDNRVTPGSTETTTFTVNVTDPMSASASNSVTTVVSTSINDNPTVSGATAGQSVNDNATVVPFSGVTIGDIDSPAQTLTVSVSIDDAAKGVFTPASLAASGFADAGGGVYSFSGTAAQATVAIRALVFDPTNNRVAVGLTETSTFTITATDSASGSVSNATTTVASVSMNDAPTISGATAGQSVNDNATLTPFGGMTIGDVDSPAQTLSVSVTLDTAAKGVFTPASLTASGFVHAGGGVYTFTGTAAQATAAIRTLAFDPANDRGAVGSTETTTFTVAVTDSSSGTASSGGTTVISTSINDNPTISGAAAGQTVNENGTITPFSGMTIGDVDSPAQTLSVSVTLDTAAKGVFTPA
ncbi:MAG: DUF4347 domain-containing protein, partial [bacterium]